MRHFFSLGYAAEGKTGNALTLSEHSFGDFNYLELMKGTRIGQLPDNMRLVVNQSHPEAFEANVVVCPFGWIILSCRLSERLASVAGDDVELIQAPITSACGKRIPGFFAINPLRFVDALSESKTIRSNVLLGNARPVLKPCITAAKVPIHSHVFRLVHNKYSIVVDDTVREALTLEPHEGLAFLPIEQD